MLEENTVSFNFGRNIHISIFGQSHSKGMGVVIDSLPPGKILDTEKIEAFMARRRPGTAFSTSRKEEDRAEIISGLADGRTCGSPLCAVIENRDCRSSDYEKLRDIPRPMHADYPASVKYGGYNDIAGGGHFSGRLTAPLCFAGAVCMQLLEEKGIRIGAHISSIGNISDINFDPVNTDNETLDRLRESGFPVLDPQAGEKMKQCISEVRAASDSIGGIIECCITGLPAGIGESGFDSLESILSQVLFSIPAVKGVEFGCGFAAAAMRGSEHNDPYYMDEKGNVRTVSNNHGGILGGLSTGMPVVFRAAFKPTPSIGLAQESISLSGRCNTVLQIEGRHDPCIVVRAVPCVEAAAAVVIYDFLAGNGGLS